MKTGFFDIEIVKQMNAAKDFNEAKAIAVSAIEAQPNARPENKKKAMDAINRTKSKNALLIAAGNFMLAHPSENLGMSK